MPNDDETFMQERLGFTTMAELFGQPAPCANNARVTINGQYYGLFVNEEHVGGGFIRRVFPEAPNGDLFAGGYTPKTNELMPNKDKLKAFWAASDITVDGGGDRSRGVGHRVGRRGAASTTATDTGAAPTTSTSTTIPARATAG